MASIARGDAWRLLPDVFSIYKSDPDLSIAYGQNLLLFSDDVRLRLFSGYFRPGVGIS